MNDVGELLEFISENVARASNYKLYQVYWPISLHKYDKKNER